MGAHHPARGFLSDFGLDSNSRGALDERSGRRLENIHALILRATDPGQERQSALALLVKRVKDEPLALPTPGLVQRVYDWYQRADPTTRDDKLRYYVRSWKLIASNDDRMRAAKGLPSNALVAPGDNRPTATPKPPPSDASAAQRELDQIMSARKAGRISDSQWRSKEHQARIHALGARIIAGNSK